MAVQNDTAVGQFSPAFDTRATLSANPGDPIRCPMASSAGRPGRLSARAQNVYRYPSKIGPLLARIFHGVEEFGPSLLDELAEEAGVRLEIIGREYGHEPAGCIQLPVSCSIRNTAPRLSRAIILASLTAASQPYAVDV